MTLFAFRFLFCLLLFCLSESLSWEVLVLSLLGRTDVICRASLAQSAEWMLQRGGPWDSWLGCYCTSNSSAGRHELEEQVGILGQYQSDPIHLGTALRRIQH